MKFASRISKSVAKACAGCISLFVVSCSLAFALPVFTWDPSRSTPPLSGLGSAFSADTLLMSSNLHSVIQPNGSFQEEFVLRIEQFQLGNQVVDAPGLNSASSAADSYGLYFTIDASGQLVAGVTTFNTLQIALIGDPGNNNGTLVSNTSGIAFANSGTAGTADDITLGTGTLVSAMMSFDPVTGVRSAHFVESFEAVASQAAFFVTPLDVPSLLEQFLTTPLSAFAAVPGPDGTTIVTVNGGTARANFVPQLAPEPSSLMLLSGGVLVLWFVRRRRKPLLAPSL